MANSYSSTNSVTAELKESYVIYFLLSNKIQKSMQIAYVYFLSKCCCENKKAQLSLGKMRYRLYSSCCSTNLQRHPRPM